MSVPPALTNAVIVVVGAALMWWWSPARHQHRDVRARATTLATRPDAPAADRDGRLRTRRRALVVVGATAVAFFAGPFAAVVLGAVVELLRRMKRVEIARRATSTLAADVPDLLELLVVIIRAGHQPGDAFALAAQLAPASLRPACREVQRRQHVGERLADALTSLPPQLAPCTRLLARADRYGEPLAPLLDRLADDARAERRRLGEAAARRLPVRLCFPLATCTLPSFVVLTIVPLLAGALSSLRVSI